MISREKVKYKKIFTAILILAIFTFGSFTVSAAGKKFYWLVTDENLDPASVSVEYYTTWTGLGLEERIAEFQWYADSGSNRGAPSIDSDQPMGGVKAIVTMTGSGNDWQLVIQIYKGGASNPSIGPEEYKWTILNGKVASLDIINVVFTETISGKTAKVVSLHENDQVTVGIPRCSVFNCRMWLI